MGINLSNMVKLQCQFSFSNHFHMWNFFSESMRTLIFLQVRSHTYIFLHMYISLLCLHTEPNMDNHSPNRQVSTKKSHNRVAAGVIGWPRRTRLHSVQNEIRSFPTCLSARSSKPVQPSRNGLACILVGPWPRLLLGLLPQPSIVISLFSHNRDNRDNRVKWKN